MPETSVSFVGWARDRYTQPPTGEYLHAHLDPMRDPVREDVIHLRGVGKRNARGTGSTVKRQSERGGGGGTSREYRQLIPCTFQETNG